MSRVLGSAGILISVVFILLGLTRSSGAEHTPEAKAQEQQQALVEFDKGRITKRIKEWQDQITETAKLPRKIQTQLPRLCEGDFVGKAENILAFGLPGRGKTHVCAAIGHELVQRGYQVLFQPAFRIVQRLLIAKRDFELERALKRLDHFDVVIIDDIGYVQQDREEMEVLFTFLAERYERRSVMITSNLVFSEWDKIFKDPMTTAAAIDRVVHHSTILELSGESYRAEAAQKRSSKRTPQEAALKETAQ